jgi:hypothetical protein
MLLALPKDDAAPLVQVCIEGAACVSSGATSQGSLAAARSGCPFALRAAHFFFFAAFFAGFFAAFFANVLTPFQRLSEC